MTDKRATSFRLSLVAEGLLAWKAEELGISKTAVLELAIRAFAYQQPQATHDALLAARIEELAATLDQG